MTACTARTVLKIEGPPGSGKTRELAREACRLIAQEGVLAEQILFLGISYPNLAVLKNFLTEEATLAGLEFPPCPFKTLDAFCLDQFQSLNPGRPVAFLDDETATGLLTGLLYRGGHLDLSETLRRQASLSRAVWELFQELHQNHISPERFSEALSQAAPSAGWLSTLYREWTDTLERLSLVPRAQALAALNGAEGVALPYRVILADEVQEWSDAHHRFFEKLPATQVLAGHAGFSIRSGWGAKPERFERLQATTYLTKQACMRGLEPVLSLLNGFLSKPMWEEQAVDRERLHSCVRFGYYSDPQQEANALAARLREWVSTATVEERPATWNDCVVLLRSPQYEPYLASAFLTHELPFASEVVTPEVLQVQHGLYDLLCILEALDALGLEKSAGLQPVSGLSTLETLDFCQKANRHIRRWLELMLKDDAIVLDWKRFDEGPLLLAELLSQISVPAVVLRWVKQCLDWHARFQAEKSIPALIAWLEAEWLPAVEEREDNTVRQAWRSFREKVDGWENRFQHGLSGSMQLSELLTAYALFWKTPEDRKNANQLQVRILPFHAMQGAEASLVAIPFMVADEFPKTRHGVELIPEAVAKELALDLSANTAEVARLLAMGMSRARKALWFSSHQMDQNHREAPVLPSPFFLTLFNEKRKLLDRPVSFEICGCEQNACILDDCGFAERQKFNKQDMADRYCGTSVWANYTPAETEPLFDEDAILTLSASAIQTYMSCPRQFYYRHLLQIRLPQAEAAQLGTIIHRVMEIFNRNAHKAPYTADELKRLANCLFLYETDPESFRDAGFSPEDQKALEALNPLALDELKQRLLAAIEDLERKGYFAAYGNAKRIQAETRLEEIVIEGIEGCRFHGMLDALIQRADGRWDILDYKTYRTKYGAKPDTCERHFAGTLAPLPDEPDLSRAERFWDRLHPSYPKDYQLPLYYLACAGLPEYRDKIRAVALQMVRPQFPDDPQQGAIRLELSADAIEAAREQLVSDINRYVVQPIRSAEVFEADPVNGCEFCQYRSICDTGIAGETDDAEVTV